MTIKKYLYSLDSKNKIRVLIISVIQGLVDYTIHRETGLLDGKLISQPVLSVVKGKAGRTISQQVELQVNSIINKQREKGYKLLTELTSGDIDPMDYTVIESLMPKVKTFTNGERKLMLAKDPKPGVKYFTKNQKWPTPMWQKDWFISRKLDGIRAAVISVDGEFKAFSRTGKSLNVPFTHIFKDLDLTRVSQYIGEDKMIDGELYKHGKRLQLISGIAALKVYDSTRHDQLEFWIFDYADDTSTAEQRAKKLNALIPMLKGSKIKINVQSKVTSYEDAKVLHDSFVTDGYEGAILRDASALYGYGVRDDRMIKLKEFQDDEFEITGFKLGLRGAEDMCFTCKTEDGKYFEAKPIGDKATKVDYLQKMPTLIGLMATVKFFYYTEDGIPCLPSMVAIRDYE